ncbi:MAG: ABC transporter ATP-binding protein [Lachnospiraceae bacterium]|nr:ABC transporter ATP-binding protein [Lachnospiraceae bacterium]
MKAVMLDHVSKIYADGKIAVDSVSLCLEPGEIFGFLGPNGAGKTTTVKLLNGMLIPTQGTCTVFGINPAVQPEKMHAFSGVVTEHAQMYDTLTGLQNLIFYGTVFGLGASESEKRGKKLLRELELTEAENKKLSAYSTGMRQRLSLARALLHEPKILFLDEPTSGLDPESAKNVHAMICRLAEEKGITIFLCTHQLRYAEEICTRYGLLADGRLLAEGTLDALRKRLCSGITICIEADGAPKGLLCRQVRSSVFEVEADSRDEIPELVRRFVEAGKSVYQVSATEPSLENIYFAMTKMYAQNPSGD